MNEDVSTSVQTAGLPQVRRPRRTATTMDRLRTREFLRLVEEGKPELDAFWQVASDPRIGFSRFRGATESPGEVVLTRKLAAMLDRTAPTLVLNARQIALAKLAGLGEPAVRAVQEIVDGEGVDERMARARLDAAKTILGALGIGERGGLTVATQINVGDKRLRGDVPEGA